MMLIKDGQSELFVGAPNYTVNGQITWKRDAIRFTPFLGTVAAPINTHLIYGEEEYGAFGGMISCSKQSGLVAVGSGYSSPNGLEKSGVVYVYDPQFSGMVSASQAIATIERRFDGSVHGRLECFWRF